MMRVPAAAGGDRAGRGLLSVLALGVAFAPACAVDDALDGIEVSARADRQRVVLDPMAAGARPPAADATAPAPSGGPVTFGVSKIFLGDTDRAGAPSSNAWADYGYNLDGIASTASGSNHCSPLAGADPAVQSDGTDGIDNAFGHLVLPILTRLAPGVSAEIDASLTDGAFTVMLHMTSFDGSARQRAVQARVYAGAPVPEADRPPVFDGSFAWDVAPACLNAGDIDQPKDVFSAGHVTGGTWVSGSPQAIELSIPIRGGALTLPIAHAVVSMEIDSDGRSARNGVISGVISTERLVAAVRRVAGALDTDLCEGSAFDTIAQQIRAASDIMADGSNGDASASCDAVSIGLGFDAGEVRLGVVDPTAGTPGDPCAIQ